VQAQVRPSLVGIGKGEAHGVEIVIAHNGERGSATGHRHHDAASAQILGPPIDEIADEYSDTSRMRPRSVAIHVVHGRKQRFEPCRLAVDIPDYVVTSAVMRLHQLSWSAIATDAGGRFGSF
jgi:hypothetical protein